MDQAVIGQNASAGSLGDHTLDELNQEKSTNDMIILKSTRTISGVIGLQNEKKSYFLKVKKNKKPNQILY